MIPYRVSSYLWRKYADYLYNKFERDTLWRMLEPYRQPKSFIPILTIHTVAFYTGVIGTAVQGKILGRACGGDRAYHEATVLLWPLEDLQRRCIAFKYVKKNRAELSCFGDGTGKSFLT